MLNQTSADDMNAPEPTHLNISIASNGSSAVLASETSESSAELHYTGERHMTDQVGLALSLGHIDHMVRYAAVAPFVAGKRVLDISCGSGYGSQFLALQGASAVVGVDIDAESIAYARKFHAHSVVTYYQGDAQDVHFLEDASFDVIVSFETIEHLERPRDFLLELRRLLKPGGQGFISCPNDYRVSPWISEFHLHRFRFSEFRDLIVNTFGEATFLGQHNTATSCLLKPTQTDATTSQFGAYRTPVPSETLGNQYIDQIAPIENAMGYVAFIGVDPALVSNYISFSEPAFQDVMTYFTYAVEESKQAKQQLDTLTTQLFDEKQAALAAHEATLEVIKTQLQEVQAQLQETQLQLEQSHAQQSKLQIKLKQSTELVAYQQNRLLQFECDYLPRTQVEQMIQPLKAGLEQAQTTIANLREKIAKKQDRIQFQKANLDQHQTELTDARARITAMETSKFWKMRKIWFNVKRLLGLPGQE